MERPGLKDESSTVCGKQKGRDLDIKRIVAAQYLQINSIIFFLCRK